MKNYVSYLRVSTSKQKRSGLGLEAQRSIINYFAKECLIVREFIETESAKDIASRPLLKEAIDFCLQSNHTLIVAKLDRLSRDVEDTFFLLKQLKYNLAICDIPFENIDSFTLAIFAGLAQREREIISLRTKQALAEKKKKGFLLGTPNNLTLESRLLGIKKAQLKVKSFYNRKLLIALMEKLIRERFTLQQISDILNNEGFRTFRGNKYNKLNIHRLILNIEKYQDR